MLPIAVQSIRDRLSVLANDATLVRSLPERSNNFSEELNGMNIVTLLWEQTTPFKTVSTDGALLLLNSVVTIEIRQWGMSLENGLLHTVNRVISRLANFTPLACHEMTFTSARFEGYAEVSKRWVAKVMFNCRYSLLTDEPETEPVYVRELTLEERASQEDQEQIRSIFAPEPTPLVLPYPTEDLLTIDRLVLVDADAYHLIEVTLTAVLEEGGRDSVVLSSGDSVYLPYRSGVPVTARLRYWDGWISLTASDVGGAGVIQSFPMQAGGELYAVKRIVVKQG